MEKKGEWPLTQVRKWQDKKNLSFKIDIKNRSLQMSGHKRTNIYKNLKDPLPLYNALQVARAVNRLGVKMVK